MGGFFFNDTATTEIYTRCSSAASDVYKRQDVLSFQVKLSKSIIDEIDRVLSHYYGFTEEERDLSLIHISEPTRPY